MTMSFSMYGSRAQGQTESHARRELHHHHHHQHAQELASREAKFPSTKTRSLTCQRLNVNRRAPRFGILAAALLLLLHLCLDMNDASSRRRRFSYCHAFQPAGSTSASFHARNRRLSTRPRTTSLSSSASAEEEESVDDNAAFLSDGNFVEETFQERYGSSSSQLPVLPDWLIRKCNECGWTHPTRIQQRALDVICVDKRDAIIQAETGSGKTLAYLLPALACIDPSRATVQALIVVPTRELGLQVARVAKRLAASSASTLENETGETVDDADISNGREDKIMVMNVLQGSQNRRQRAWAWAEPPHLIIGTPQEVCDMVRFGGIKRYNSVKYVVVDEVDACLLNNAGVSSSATLTGALSSSTTLLHQLLSKYLSPTFNDGSSSNGDENANGSSSSTSSLLNANAKSMNGQSARPVSRQRQTIFASATIPQHRHFLKQVVQNKWALNHRPPVHVCLRSSSSGRSGGGGEQLIPQRIQHAYIVVSRCTSSDEDNENKFTALRSVLKKIFKSSRLDDATSTAKKVLVFAENKRPLESMAERLALDFERIGGLYWTESTLVHSPEYNKARAIFAVLRFEDSLTQRASAMDCLRGEEDQQQAWQSRPARRRKQQQQVQQDFASEGNSTDSISNSPATATAAITSHRQSPAMRVLLSSDLASRGVDIPDLTHVIQFDLPTSADAYLHMAGRTGRLGRSGQVLSIITSEQEFVLQRLANKLSIDIRRLARQ